jgi:hypothetical protein
METSSVSRYSAVAQRRIHIISYTCQVAAIFVVILACVVNLSLGDDKAALWSSLLSGSLGYLLPAPKLRKYDAFLPNTTIQQLDEVLSEQHDDTVHNKIDESG